MQEDTSVDPFEEGHRDPRPTLQDRLPTAPPRYVQGALLNPAMDEKLAEVLLRNAGLTEPILRDLAGRFRRSDAVKLALVSHPQTPAALSMQLVKFLHWRDLLDLMGNARLSQPLRSVAEQTVGERMNQMPAMEQAKLARNAARGIVAALLRSRNPRVIQELMLNPRLTERDVVALARDRGVPSETLASLARHGVWVKRPPVRKALLENHSTPAGEAVKLLGRLAVHELRNLLRNPRLRPLLRTEAEKLLRKAQTGP